MITGLFASRNHHRKQQHHSNVVWQSKRSKGETKYYYRGLRGSKLIKMQDKSNLSPLNHVAGGIQQYCVLVSGWKELICSITGIWGIVLAVKLHTDTFVGFKWNYVLRGWGYNVSALLLCELKHDLIDQLRKYFLVYHFNNWYKGLNNSPFRLILNYTLW